jgi:hypothetical protein
MLMDIKTVLGPVAQGFSEVENVNYHETLPCCNLELFGEISFDSKTNMIWRYSNGCGHSFQWSFGRGCLYGLCSRILIKEMVCKLKRKPSTGSSTLPSGIRF